MSNQRRMEVQKRKRVFKKMVGLFLLFVLCAVIASFTPYFNVKKINVTGNSRVSVQQIKEVSGIREGSNIFRVKLNSVRRKLEDISYVHSVRVKREFPNQISIEIEESRPVAAASYLGDYVLIDMYGKTLEQESPEKLDNLSEIVILTGLEVKNFELGEKIIVENERNLKIVLESLTELVHNSLIENMNEIDLNQEDGIVFKMNDSKLTVLMGDAADLPYRVKFLKEILNKLGGTPRGVIDFTAKDPTYRLSESKPAEQEEEEGEETEESEEETEEDTEDETEETEESEQSEESEQTEEESQEDSEE